jgi:crotonobetainyl-CoA:carnitine CoA-transferase CaiB-like acyl-CoA transferase
MTGVAADNQPLRGIRVIDAATNVAGPYGASVLADLGADVIKVEPLAGDPVRRYPPFADGVASQFASVNHAKRYVGLDLRRPEGRAVLHRLLTGADALVQNARAGHETRLGLDAGSCHAVNSRLIHVTVAAFHPVDGDRPGYDLLVQGESGLLHQTGEPDRPPSRIGAAVIDHATGLWIALAIVSELRGPRERTALRVSMLDVATGLLNDKIAAQVVSGEDPPRMGSGTSVATPHGVFPTADEDIVIGAPTDANFLRLAELLGPPLQGDERFVTQAGRLGNRAELEGLIADALASHGADHWIATLSAAGVAVGRVSSLPEAVARHREHSATGMRAVAETEGLEVVAPAVSIDDARWAPLPRPGAVGSDNDGVLAEAGIGADELTALRAEGLIT